ncbi:hypothetical protein IPM62_01350 [Candidatus Woesebacteria bacterium]|nr:MAG: hypothetical protein IPM62_01350 [Candidatus Woesebacteria bacterium]
MTSEIILPPKDCDTCPFFKNCYTKSEKPRVKKCPYGYRVERYRDCTIAPTPGQTFDYNPDDMY